MDRSSLLAALERDGLAFAHSCQAAGLDADVQACPEWNVADLVWHLAEVHYFWSTVVHDCMASPDGYVEPARPANDQLVQFYLSNLQRTLQVLGDADPATPVWTWTTDHTAGFVLRRMAHETAVHRWDADRAARRDMPIEAQLASDGIDEFLEHFMAAPVADEPFAGHSAHLHCTDVAGEWTVVPDGAALSVTRQHAKGDCAIRGAASDILLVLWRRQTIDTVDVVGDAGVAAQFVARNSLD